MGSNYSLKAEAIYPIYGEFTCLKIVTGAYELAEFNTKDL